MINKSNTTRFLTLIFAAVALCLVSGNIIETKGQKRDPFTKPGYAKPKVSRPSSSTGPSDAVKPDKPKGPVVVAVPAIDLRINYYKMMREQAALNGLPIPKVTSVLTLDEMTVTGIFRTPRGYGAMVEAKPINLSYTIYPGEKFFDGQLVAVEENRLVFRKVTKMSNNKFISAVENKTLRQYSVQEEVQGTAPLGTSGAVESARNEASGPATRPDMATPAMVISPLDEMNNQPPIDVTDANKDKKAVKVAKGRKQ